MISLPPSTTTTTSQTHASNHSQSPTSLHIKPRATATSPSTPVSGCAPTTAAPPAAVDSAAPDASAVALPDVTTPASVRTVLDERVEVSRAELDSSSSSAAALDMVVVVGEADAEGVAMDAVHNRVSISHPPFPPHRPEQNKRKIAHSPVPVSRTSVNFPSPNSVGQHPR
jgi:hypothetical protein